MAAARRRVGALALEAGTSTEERFLAATAARLPVSDWPGNLVLTAVDAERGRRVALSRADGVPLRSALAASRAIPGLLSPVAIRGRRHIDGAVGSATNADLAAGAARVFIVTATPGDALADTLFALWNGALAGEIEELEAMGTRVTLVRADHADQAAMGPDLMSGARAPEAFAAGRLRGLLLQ